MKKIAIISGVSGQDGAFLANTLLKNGYQVIGTSRNASTANFNFLQKLNILDSIELVSLSLLDLQGIVNLIKKYNPTEIYNLSGQSSVGQSFEKPHLTIESVVMGTLNFLEAIRIVDKNIKFYNAGSGEMFGSTRERVTEETQLSPQSPYAVAKATSFLEVATYRKNYGLFAVTGILFNHESPFRGDKFVTQKIIKGVVGISKGQADKLELGNIYIKRDWGSAPEYMEAAWKMLQIEEPVDLVIATGETHSLVNFLEIAFGYFKLNWKDYVVTKDSLRRTDEVDAIYTNPSKAQKKINWKAKVGLEKIIGQMIEFELNNNMSLEN